MSETKSKKKGAGPGARLLIWVALTIIGYLIVFWSNETFYEDDPVAEEWLLIGSMMVAGLIAFLADPKMIPLLTLGLINSEMPKYRTNVYLF